MHTAKMPLSQNVKLRHFNIKDEIVDFQKLCKEICKLNQIFKREKYLAMIGFYDILEKLIRKWQLFQALLDFLFICVGFQLN